MLAAAIAVALLAAGCGNDTEDTGVTTIGLLSTALADTAEASEASSYRVSLSVAAVWKIEGEKLSTGLDEQSPAFVCEVTPEREHCRFDISRFLESMLGFTFADWVDLGFEVWFDQDQIVMDTSAFQQLADVDPEVDLGPLAPGVFFIDLSTLEAGSSELMDAVAGSSTPDLREMAARLPAALITIEQTSTDPPTFVGTTTSARLDEALGWNTEDEARSGAAELGMATSADLDELAELLLDFYETNSVEVVIELDERGLLSVLWTDEDLSGIWRIFAESEDLGAELSEEERQLFKSIEFRMATRVAYEPDTGIEVPLPPQTAEDRTEEWREFLAEPSLGG